jgi:hypothetical protein
MSAASRLPRAGRLAVLALVASWAVALPVFGASRVLPHLAFRVLRTPHFRIYYHQGEERLARTLAGIVESVRDTVPARLGLPAPEVTHVLLVDQDDAANGWATPLPYNTVMVTAAWPAASDIIGNTSDWLRLVFTHEYAHILQLHQSRGWARAVRSVFGRVPIAFPNLFLPEWEIEGLATYVESRENGADGRLRSGDSRAIVQERRRTAGVQPIDQLNGGQAGWPGGLGPYLYGGFFADYLATKYGEESLGDVSRRSAGRLPYLSSAAFRETFGRGLGELWADYQQSLLRGSGDEKPREAPGADRVPGDASRRLTWGGYRVSTPRYAAHGSLVLYGRQNPDDFPAVAAVERGRRGAVRTLVTRYGGEQLSAHGRLAFFDAADYAVNVAWRSDLFVTDVESGRTQRLTRDARLVAPDVSPDGRWLACISLKDGGRSLALFRVEGSEVGRLTLSAVAVPGGLSGAIYGAPRWSPDGSRLAAERRQPKGCAEIVVVDPVSGESHVAASTLTGRVLSPAWLPDGRTLLFTSDRDGGDFRVFATDLDTGRVAPVLAAAGGALFPDVSPDGQRLVYVGYTGRGYDLFEAPMPALSDSYWTASLFTGPAAAAGSANGRLGPNGSGDIASGVAPAVPDEEPYSPLETLLPRSWQPAADIVDNHLRIGASTAGTDVLARHSFGLTALWRVQAGSASSTVADRARPDWSAFYVYDRWRPSFFVAASDDTTFRPQYVGGTRVGDAQLRETQASVGVSLPFLGVRRGQVWQTALAVDRNVLSTVRGERRFARNALQSGWAFNSARVFGYSVSPEQGVAIGVTSEQVRAAFGADGNADAFTGEVRGYMRLGTGHVVLASRAAIGAATGDANVSRVFYLGGPEPVHGLIDFGSRAFSLLRGFPDQVYAAGHVGAANVELRFPVRRIERGLRTWPFFLKTVHAAAFLDTGQVWDHRFSWSGTKASAGAEVSLDTVLGFGLPMTLSVGVAHPLGREQARGTTTYVRVGRAF